MPMEYQSLFIRKEKLKYANSILFLWNVKTESLLHPVMVSLYGHSPSHI